MVGRTKLIAWGTAGALHAIGFFLLSLHNFEHVTSISDVTTVDLAIISPQSPLEAPALERKDPQPPAPKVKEKTVQEAPPPTRPRGVTPTLDPEAVSTTIPPTSPPGPERRVTRRFVQTHSMKAPEIAPFRETPPGPVLQTLRAFQCARLSPSQRRHCPTSDSEDEHISILVAEAKTAEPIYDPVLNVYRARTVLDRAERGVLQPGAFSAAENPNHLRSNGSGDAATNSLVTRLNANPEPLFDGGRYQNWDSDAGRPGE